MQVDGYFKLLSDISSTELFHKLQREVLNFDWDQDICLSLNAAEDTIAFKDCYVLQMFGSPLMLKIRPSFNDKPYTEKTRQLIKTVEKTINPFLQGYLDHYLLKAHMVALKPEGKQVRHIDGHLYHYNARRIVLPITTNPNCFTSVENRTFQLTPGKYFEMHNNVVHGSENHGTTIRCTLFLDLIPSKNLPTVMSYYNKSTLAPFDVEFPNNVRT